MIKTSKSIFKLESQMYFKNNCYLLLKTKMDF